MTDQTHTPSGAIMGLPMQVRHTTLLAIMFFVPFAAVLPFIDQLAFGGSIYDYMKAQPKEIAYWAAILSLPHIIASLVTFADREYISHYKTPLLKGMAVSVFLGFGITLIIGPIGTLLIMAFYTMYHNLQQQYGIALMILRMPPDKNFTIWRWLTIIPAGLTYLVLLGADDPYIGPHKDAAIVILGVCLFIAAFFGVRFYRSIPKSTTPRIGIRYFILTAIELYVCFALIIGGYVILAMIVPRIVHDLTAFWIYMVHDQNRNAQKTMNPFYYLPKKLGLPPVLICVPLSLAITYTLLFWRESAFFVVMLVLALNFMHYYMEGHMWKRGTPHRQYVPFV